MKPIGVFKLKGGKTGRIGTTVTIEYVFFIYLEGEGFRYSCSYWRVYETIILRNKIEKNKNMSTSIALLYKFLGL